MSLKFMMSQRASVAMPLVYHCYIFLHLLSLDKLPLTIRVAFFGTVWYNSIISSSNNLFFIFSLLCFKAAVCSGWARETYRKSPLASKRTLSSRSSSCSWSQSSCLADSNVSSRDKDSLHRSNWPICAWKNNHGQMIDLGQADSLLKASPNKRRCSQIHIPPNPPPKHLTLQNIYTVYFHTCVGRWLHLIWKGRVCRNKSKTGCYK